MAALADQADVEARLRRYLTKDEEAWLDGILNEASILVTSYCGQRFTESVPDEVKVVTSRVAARGVTAMDTSEDTNTESVQVNLGPFNVNHKLSADAASGGVYLSKADKLTLAPWRIAGQVFSIDMA